MKPLERRVQAMEAALPPQDGERLDLGRLSDADLERLEGIAIRRDAGEAIEDMPDDDLRFLASIRVIKTEGGT